MPERYPDNATLLALTQDSVSGVEYIPTGLSPYHLAFRRLQQRLLLTSARANDLRVYQDGDLTIGVRPGRCFMGEPVVFEGQEALDVADHASSYIWLDTTGQVQTGTGGFPEDRTTFFPLALVTTEDAITSITDLRGEAFLHIPSRRSLNMTAALQAVHEGPLGASITGKLVGAAPFAGTVVDIVLSIGTNLVTGTDEDSIAALVAVNGEALTTTAPAVHVGAGTGFRSTAQGDGAAAAIETSGIQNVSAGDLISVDLVRTATGVPSVEATDVVVAVIIRPS